MRCPFFGECSFISIERIGEICDGDYVKCRDFIACRELVLAMENRLVS